MPEVEKQVEQVEVEKKEEKVEEPTTDYLVGAPAITEKLSSDKLAKKLKDIVKEGGKRGVEIEGNADLSGLKFFPTKVEKPNGDLDMLIESVKAMNAHVEKDAEERKGGSGHIGKFVSSFSSDEKSFAMVCYVPEVSQSDKCDATMWLNGVLELLCVNSKVTIDERSNKSYAFIQVKNNPEQDLFCIKLRDPATSMALNWLRTRELFPKDDGDDDEDEMVFGDDDFPL